MSFWQIVLPMAAQNLVTAPTIFSGGSTVPSIFTASGGALSVDQTLTRRGTACLKEVPSAGTFDGFYHTVSLISGTTYYASVDLFGALNIPYRVYFANNSGSGVLGTAGSSTGSGYWAADRPVATYTAGSTGTFRVYVAKNSSSSTAPFWADGFMVQSAGSGSTYVDGAQPGCSWDGLPYASTSSRPITTREGGNLVDLSTYAVALDQYQGVGMPDVANILFTYGLQDGAFYQRSKDLPRIFTLVSTVNTSLQTNATWNTLHANRKAFIDAVRHDAIPQDAPFWLRYSGTAKPMWIKAIYQDGLKADIGAASGFMETPSPVFVCPDPFWYEDGTDAAILSGSTAITNANGFMIRTPSGQWASLGTGASYPGGGEFGYAVQGNPDGTAYLGGLFTTLNGTTVNHIAKWNPATATLATLAYGGSVGVNSAVRALAEDSSGNLFLGGDFTTAGSATVNHFAKWDGTTFTAALSGGSIGFNGSVYGIAPLSINGSTYICGNFTTAGSVTAINGIAKWVPLVNPFILPLTYGGSSGVRGGTGGSGSHNAYCITADPSFQIYIGGDFDHAGSLAASNVVKWNGTSFVALGPGLNGIVYAVTSAPDGTIYAGGTFTSTGSLAGGATHNCIAAWNGTSWQPLGSGLTAVSGTAVVNNITILQDGSICAVGYFDHAGGIPISDGIAIWNGSSWTYSDANGPQPYDQFFGVFPDSHGYLYLGFNLGGTAAAATSNTITNTGSATVYPVVTFTGPGTLYQMKNYTTGKVIYFNITLLTGETATLNLTPGNISFTSSYRGNILSAILPGSNLTTFGLSSGDNLINVFTSTGANSVFWQWDNRHHSVDGGAN